jgi:hypothetical protein
MSLGLHFEQGMPASPCPGHRRTARFGRRRSESGRRGPVDLTRALHDDSARRGAGGHRADIQRLVVGGRSGPSRRNVVADDTAIERYARRRCNVSRRSDRTRLTKTEPPAPPGRRAADRRLCPADPACAMAAGLAGRRRNLCLNGRPGHERLMAVRYRVRARQRHDSYCRRGARESAWTSMRCLRWPKRCGARGLKAEEELRCAIAQDIGPEALSY